MAEQTQKYLRAELRKREELIRILDPLVKEWFFQDLINIYIIY